MLEPGVSFTNERTLTDARLVAPRSVADALDALYADQDYLRAMSLTAYKLATQPTYSWDGIAERWDNVFMRLLEQDDPPAADSITGGMLSRC